MVNIIDPNSRFGEKFGEDDDPDTPTIPTVFKWSLPGNTTKISIIHHAHITRPRAPRVTNLPSDTIEIQI